ncbi:hypothetical protein B0H11DRAFT_1807134 [Mycena galericulata]|nr:hypothetical protein B0H11DRAFT_1807134 [Mycena galericulata]
MPHRVEPYPTMSQPATYPYPAPAPPNAKNRRSPYDRRASPPPIATLPTHSGSPSPSASSLDRSAVSTPPVGARRSPPAQQQQQPPPPAHHYAPYDIPRGYAAPGGYMYAPAHHAHAPPPHGYHHHPDDAQRAYEHGHHAQTQQQHHYAHPAAFPGGYVPYPLPGTILSAPMAPPQGAGANGNGGAGGGGVIQVVHTDDAATKLSDRVRRRCFNCCTTDTSTWRRSNLSPGKVLCNKCGLFERTHSRPRPEQFPHKRGPLASSTLRSRSPPGVTNAQPYYAPPPQPSSTSASAPSSTPAPTSASAPPSASANGNTSISHPSTPKPPSTSTSANGNANGTGASPRLPGVDSWLGKRERAGEGEGKGSPRERDEEGRRDRERDERRVQEERRGGSEE